MKTPRIKSIVRSPWRRGVLLLPLALGCFGLLPAVRAVVPAPDGGYPGGNTAEGQGALFSLTGGIHNTALGFQALFNNTTGNANLASGSLALRNNTSGLRNTAAGFSALSSNTTGFGNTATGCLALSSNTIANDNTANGFNTLVNNTTGFRNTADGQAALSYNVDGDDNTAVGQGALFHNTDGNSNTALGSRAGFDQTTGSNNVYIGAGLVGVAGESNACYIASIFGQTSGSGASVLINATGKLGTTTSSKRFKEEIKPMDNASEALFALKPVAFRYKKDIDPQRISQLGLVAEDVEKVNPDLVVRDKEGKPYSVRYDQVNAMLLNEFLKEHRKVEEQSSKIQQQQATITELKSTVAQQQKDFQATAAHQQKQIEALTAGLQKVNAELEASKPAPRVVNNP